MDPFFFSFLEEGHMSLEVKIGSNDDHYNPVFNFILTNRALISPTISSSALKSKFSIYYSPRIEKLGPGLKCKFLGCIELEDGWVLVLNVKRRPKLGNCPFYILNAWRLMRG